MRRTGILILSLALSFSILGQKKELVEKAPNKNDHEFIIGSDMRSAFQSTQAYLRLELGYSAIFSTPGIQFQDTTIYQLTNEILFTRLGFGYQQRVKDWIAFYARFSFDARIGTGVEAIITEGINTIQSREFGVSFELMDREKFRWSGYATVNSASAEIYDIPQYVRDLVNREANARIKRKILAVNAGFGSLLSYAPYKSFGISLDNQFTVGETLERGKNSFIHYNAMSLDLMLNHLINVPLSATLSGSMSNLPSIFSITNDTSYNQHFKITYNGSESFFIGIELYGGRTPIRDTTRRVGISGYQLHSVFFF